MLIPQNPRPRNTDVRWLGVLRGGCALGWVCSGLGVLGLGGCALGWVFLGWKVGVVGLRVLGLAVVWAGCAYRSKSLFFGLLLRSSR